MHESFFDSLHTSHEKIFCLRIFHDFACMIMINFMRCCSYWKLCVFIKINFFGNFSNIFTTWACDHATFAQHSLTSLVMHSLNSLSWEKSQRFLLLFWTQHQSRKNILVSIVHVSRKVFRFSFAINFTDFFAWILQNKI
jgi:hypothetical protein